jgi:predicted KAP-like P-loop ATPase
VTTARRSGLWSDDPASIDLLSFDAVAQTVTDALLDDTLDPIALGLSGSWGSGKTTVLGLVAQELDRRKTAEQKVLVIQTDPWRYDPSTGAKESLIAEVLGALTAEVASLATKTDKANNLLVRLGKRIDWAKAIKLAANS